MPQISSANISDSPSSTIVSEISSPGIQAYSCTRISPPAINGICEANQSVSAAGRSASRLGVRALCLLYSQGVSAARRKITNTAGCMVRPFQVPVVSTCLVVSSLSDVEQKQTPFENRKFPKSAFVSCDLYHPIALKCRNAKRSRAKYAGRSVTVLADKANLHHSAGVGIEGIVVIHPKLHVVVFRSAVKVRLTGQVG